MTTSEFSFYSFYTSMQIGCLYIPVKFGTDIAFFVAKESSESIVSISLQSDSDNEISALTYDQTGDDNNAHIQVTSDLLQLIAPNNYFIIKVVSNLATYYSNLLRYMPIVDYSLLEYKCDTDEFDFAFSLEKSAKVRLPILMHSPQLPQEENIYTTLSGYRRVLFASINKEWECRTEYFDESMHEKILVALSCDNLYIDGQSVIKSDKYEIDWDNYTENECDQKIAMATFKVQQNRTIRNSNCG